MALFGSPSSKETAHHSANQTTWTTAAMVNTTAAAATGRRTVCIGFFADAAPDELRPFAEPSFLLPGEDPSSERKAISNRKNAQNSTGPRSELGRLRSRRNALRHGLAIAIGSDPSFSKDIEALATTLASVRGGQIVGEFARQVAEAHLDLVRIRELRAEHFVAIFGNPEAKIEDYRELDKNLAQLERYERRAFSRRKRAVLAMSGM